MNPREKALFDSALTGPGEPEEEGPWSIPCAVFVTCRQPVVARRDVPETGWRNYCREHDRTDLPGTLRVAGPGEPELTERQRLLIKNSPEGYAAGPGEPEEPQYDPSHEAAHPEQYKADPGEPERPLILPGGLHGPRDLDLSGHTAQPTPELTAQERQSLAAAIERRHTAQPTPSPEPRFQCCDRFVSAGHDLSYDKHTDDTYLPAPTPSPDDPGPVEFETVKDRRKARHTAQPTPSPEDA